MWAGGAAVAAWCAGRLGGGEGWLAWESWLASGASFAVEPFAVGTSAVAEAPAVVGVALLVLLPVLVPLPALVPVLPPVAVTATAVVLPAGVCIVWVGQ